MPTCDPSLMRRRKAIPTPSRRSWLALLPFMLVGWIFTPLSHASRGNGQNKTSQAQEETAILAELLRQVRENGDESDSTIFRRIAEFRTKRAASTLKDCIEELRKKRILTEAYSAYALFAGSTEEKSVLDLLVRDSIHHRRDEHRLAACRGLGRWGAVAFGRLEQVFQQSKDEDVCQTALEPLIEVMAARADAASLQLLLERFDPQDGIASRIRAALSPLRGDLVLRYFDRYLRDKTSNPLWRRMIVDLLTSWKSPPAMDVIAGCVGDADSQVRCLAIEACGKYGDRKLAAVIEPTLRDSDEAVVREAVVAIARITKGDPQWLDNALQLARSKSPAARMGAALALFEIRTEEAKEELFYLLSDADWRVRCEVVQQMANLRQKEAIPLLIDRLDKESLRNQKEIALVLRLLTGLDHGLKSVRWLDWWQNEGANFVLPSGKEALAAERARNQRAAVNTTQSTFYGLRVASDRVAFVLDHSGSMNERAGSSGRTQSDKETGPTRLDVAKQELNKPIQALPPNTLFNVILFDSDVTPWMDQLVEVDEEVKAELATAMANWKSGRGTNVMDALETAFEDPRVDTIFLLTDGQPTEGSLVDPVEIRAQVERLNRTRKIAIHCVAVGTSSPFLQALASENSGDYTESL